VDRDGQEIPGKNGFIWHIIKSNNLSDNYYQLYLIVSLLQYSVSI